MVAVGFVCATTLPVVNGCASAAWNGRVKNWGELRQVRREGRTEARVALAHVIATPHCYAIGALEKLGGEATIVDGIPWVSHVTAPNEVSTTSDPATRERATFLAAAWVPRWTEFSIEKDVDPADMDRVVQEYAARAGIKQETFPFIIEGEFLACRLHVVNGRCVMGSEPDPTDGSFRKEVPVANGILVGFYSNQPPGIITHHGSRTHVHVLFQSNNPLMAHVESVGIRRGALIRLPGTR